MARDHRRLRVYHDAHSLAQAIYKDTNGFPRDEWFGLRSQIRRAAVSVPSNIVEGNARRSTSEYVNFLNIARGSAAEVSYLVHLASELGYLTVAAQKRLESQCHQLIPQLEALIASMELLMNAERERFNRERPRTRDQRPKTKDYRDPPGRA